METTIVYWGYMGTKEKKMETKTIRGYCFFGGGVGRVEGVTEVLFLSSGTLPARVVTPSGRHQFNFPCSAHVLVY